jgi:uncharacterized protein with FMN-binding domain
MKVIRYLLPLAVLAVLVGCNSAEVKAVRAMPINHVDLAKVADGTYLGDFTYGGFTYQVSVAVASHQIRDIAVVKNRTTSPAKKAEEAMKRVMEQQRNDVDAVSGATTTSKALLKAVENALNKGL